MSSATAPTPETTAIAAENSAPEADRKQIPTPEASGHIAPEAVAEALMPPKPEVKLPTPPLHVTGTAIKAPTDGLESLVQTIETEAAQKIGNYIAEQNKAGANIDTKGMTVTVSIQREAEVAKNHPCSGPGCAHCAAQVTKTQAQPAAADAATQAATPVEPPKPVEQPKPETPAIEQPAVAESKPEITSVASPVTQGAVPATTIETPAANEPMLAPEKLVANGAAR